METCVKWWENNQNKLKIENSWWHIYNVTSILIGVTNAFFKEIHYDIIIINLIKGVNHYSVKWKNIWICWSLHILWSTLECYHLYSQVVGGLCVKWVQRIGIRNKQEWYQNIWRVEWEYGDVCKMMGKQLR